MTTTEGMDREGMEMLGQIVSANVDRAAWAANQIENGLRQQIVTMAEVVVQLAKGIKESKCTVSTPALDDAYYWAGPGIEKAYRVVAESRRKEGDSPLASRVPW